MNVKDSVWIKYNSYLSMNQAWKALLILKPLRPDFQLQCLETLGSFRTEWETLGCANYFEMLSIKFSFKN